MSWVQFGDMSLSVQFGIIRDEAFSMLLGGDYIEKNNYAVF